MPNNKTLYKAPRAAGMRVGFSAKKFGAAGEDIAAAYLKKHGWRVVARNYAENGGEIDIIGYKRGKLTFFEVKTRSNETFGRPADAVGAEKTSRIKKAARSFRAECMRGGKVPVPFFFGKTLYRRVYKKSVDIIEIMLTHGGELLELNHIKDVEEL